MCLGMAVNDKLRFVMLSLTDTVSSLYKLMEDEKYLRTRLGADKWKSLIENSSLQIHECKEGFNLQRVKFCETCSRVRLGMTGDEWANCKSPDSFIGFGGQGSSTCGTPTPELVSCGNLVRCRDHEDKEIRAFGYIFVR
ncbi:Hypothetical predicted protein [Paramuricea clavata]|uniref:Uncharacterized protein n=1 Tax=Paramuricea clavata TaxID=317549 RepID=A0A6S7JX90_PARCT|nr:Hypothetical predicted protein [Paramuricea clavata]